MTTQRKLGAIGSVVKSDDELEQALLLLVGIRRGSIPHRFDLGSQLFELIDQSQSIVAARAPGMVAEAAAADGRIAVDGVEVASVEIGSLVVAVRWHPTRGGQQRTTRVTVR